MKGYFRYDVSSNSKHSVIHGTAPSEQLGASMATGDFNGDGYRDLLAGSPTYSDQKALRGKVTVFFGGEDFFENEKHTFASFYRKSFEPDGMPEKNGF